MLEYNRLVRDRNWKRTAAAEPKVQFTDSYQSLNNADQMKKKLLEQKNNV